MNKGVIIKKSKDLKEDLFWSFYDQGVVEWIDKNYTTENEDYSYCVARENMKLIYDAVKYKIPFFVDLKRKEGDANISCIFDIKNNVPDIEWFDLFREDLKREVVQCSRKELAQYIAKNYFFKSKEKGFSCKGVNDFVSKLPTGTYGQWCYPLEDRGISSEDFLSNPIAYPEAVVDMIRIHQEFLVSPLQDFSLDKEIRVIFCGSEVASVASKHDYKNELPAGIENYAEYFAKKYGEKVPYLIWSVDFHPVKDGFDIVEAHFHCDLLGKFYGNQDFKKLFETTNKILSYEK
jgi:hypothetical protein